MNPKSETRNPTSKAPPVIGLVGGVASGKSFVAAQFARLGCAVVDADRIGHELLKDPAIRSRLRERFGEKIFGPSGEVDRRLLGRTAFADRENLKSLNSITHKDLWSRVRRALTEARRQDVPAVVLDAALILEKGLDSLCDVVLYVEAPEEVRRTRAQHRGWDPGELSRREAVQISLKAKRERADYIIENRTSPEYTFDQVQSVLSDVTKS